MWLCGGDVTLQNKEAADRERAAADKARSIEDQR